MLKIYSASEVSLIYALIPIDGGRGDDEFVTISKTEASFSYKSGIDGEGTRSFNASTHFTLKVTLMQTSSMNAVLSSIHNGDITLPGGSGVAPILVRDKQGKSLFAAPEAWITKMPDLKYGKEVDKVEWEFEANGGVQFIGGN